MTNERLSSGVQDQGDALTPQEERLIECVARGESWEPEEPGGKEPDLDSAEAAHWNSNRTIRASVIRCLSVCEQWPSCAKPWPVSAKGVKINGARISGALDLEAADIKWTLALHNCSFENEVILVDVNARTISFQGSHLPGLTASRARIKGDLMLGSGFTATGKVNLREIKIQGQLSCTNGTLQETAGGALDADAMTVDGDVYLRNGFRATGEVNLRGAKIKGQLDCSGGTFENPKGAALIGNGMRVGASVFLRTGFSANGEVDFVRATIRGNFDCHQGAFSKEGGNALNLAFAKVGAGLILYNLVFLDRFQSPAGGDCGKVILKQAKCRTYRDDEYSWPDQGKLVLDGFTYERFDDSPTAWRARRGWLNGQDKNHLDSSFRPQPWNKAVEVLRAMGHDRDARELAVCREIARACSKSTKLHFKAWYFLLLVTIGNGYKPWRALWWSLSFVLASWLVLTLPPRFNPG